MTQAMANASSIGMDPYTLTPLYPVPYPVLAPIYFGALLSSAGFGVLCGQLYRYAKLGSWDLDARWLRFVVGILALLEMAYLVCASQGSWSVLVSDWMKDAGTIILPWGLKSATLFGAVSALVVHLWFARSAYRLVKSTWRWPLCALIVFCTLGQLVLSIMLFSESLFRQLGRIATQGFPMVVSHLSFAAAADLAVVIAFGTLLYRQRFAVEPSPAAAPADATVGATTTSATSTTTRAHAHADQKAGAENVALLRLLLVASSVLFMCQIVTLAVVRVKTRNTSQLFLQMVLPRVHSNVMLMCLNSPHTWRLDSQLSALRSGAAVAGSSVAWGSERPDAASTLGMAHAKGKARRNDSVLERDFGVVPARARSGPRRPSSAHSSASRRASVLSVFADGTQRAPPASETEMDVLSISARTRPPLRAARKFAIPEEDDELVHDADEIIDEEEAERRRARTARVDEESSAGLPRRPSAARTSRSHAMPFRQDYAIR